MYTTYRRAISTRKSSKARLALWSLRKDERTLLRNQSTDKALQAANIHRQKIIYDEQNVVVKRKWTIQLHRKVGCI